MDNIRQKSPDNIRVGSHQGSVRLRGVESHVDEETGDVIILVEMRPMTTQESEVLRNLFPTFSEQAYGLIMKEALFQHIITG